LGTISALIPFSLKRSAGENGLLLPFKVQEEINIDRKLAIKGSGAANPFLYG
jgi:hypothetical protein